MGGRGKEKSLFLSAGGRGIFLSPNGEEGRRFKRGGIPFSLKERGRRKVFIFMLSLRWEGKRAKKVKRGGRSQLLLFFHRRSSGGKGKCPSGEKKEKSEAGWFFCEKKKGEGGGGGDLVIFTQ